MPAEVEQIVRFLGGGRAWTCGDIPVDYLDIRGGIPVDPNAIAFFTLRLEIFQRESLRVGQFNRPCDRFCEADQPALVLKIVDRQPAECRWRLLLDDKDAPIGIDPAVQQCDNMARTKRLLN